MDNAVLSHVYIIMRSLGVKETSHQEREGKGDP